MAMDRLLRLAHFDKVVICAKTDFFLKFLNFLSNGKDSLEAIRGI